MDCATNLEDELDLYFSWLSRFEASIPQARTAVARWYTRPALQAYTGYSWFKASTPGVPALCLVSIQVAEEFRGQGCFARLVERFLHSSDDLDARVLYMENIASPRFERWPLRAGFHRCPHDAGEFSSYYLVR